jgi:hypothetical protein
MRESFLARLRGLGKGILAKLGALGKRAGVLALTVSAVAALLLVLDAILLGGHQRPDK